MPPGWNQYARCALFIAALGLPFSQPAIAVDIHYAGAIGDPYEYRPLSTETKRAPEQHSNPRRGSDTPLPGLGTESSTPTAKPERSTWSRVLVGVLVIGALSAVANRDGGSSGEVQLNTSVDTSGGTSSPSNSPPASAPPNGSAPTAPAPTPPSGGDSEQGRNDNKGRGDRDKGRD